MPQQKKPVVLDDNGNPVGVTLDDNGNVIEQAMRVAAGDASPILRLYNRLATKENAAKIAPQAGGIVGNIAGGAAGMYAGKSPSAERLGSGIGGVVGQTGGRALANYLTDKPMTEGLGQEAMMALAQELTTAGMPWAGGRIREGGRALQGKAVSPSRSVLENMAEARRMTPYEAAKQLGDTSNKFKLRPGFGGSLRKGIDLVNENTSHQRDIERVANEFGNTIDMGREVFPGMVRDSLGRVKPEDSIRAIEKNTRPTADIAATKAAIRETVTQHPQMSVPFTEVNMRTVPTGPLAEELVREAKLGPYGRTTMSSGGTSLEGINIEPQVTTRPVPNPAIQPTVLADIVRGTNAKLVDAQGIDPVSSAGITVDKAFSRNASNALDDATHNIHMAAGRNAGKSRAEIGRESHDLLNLIEGMRTNYSTAQSPVRLYEYLGSATGNVPVMMLGAFSRRYPKWALGRGMRNTGNMVEALGNNLPASEYLRAAILAAIEGGQAYDALQQER